MKNKSVTFTDWSDFEHAYSKIASKIAIEFGPRISSPFSNAEVYQTYTYIENRTQTGETTSRLESTTERNSFQSIKIYRNETLIVSIYTYKNMHYTIDIFIDEKSKDDIAKNIDNINIK